ncbi:MAG: hypothetical protein GXP08_03590 [Gammaproteobacteria bacterium]|nr:hypothetical protein [Gammaproteobacteria bacterium]
MKTYTTHSTSFLSVVLLFVLSACSGGGGGGEANNEPVVDTTSPSITINNPVEGDTYTTGSRFLSIAGISTDNIEVTEVTWSNDQGGSGSAVGTTAWSYTGLQLQLGTNLITVTAKDAANNTASDVITVIFDENFIDNEAPAITITAPSANPNYTANGNTINIAGTASDNIGVTEVTWSNDAGGTGSAIGTTNWSYTDLELSPGSNVITITAKDAANNIANDVITVIYAVNDNSPPQISVTSPSQNGQYSTDVNRVSIAGTTTDNIGVTRVTWSSTSGASGDAIGTNPWIVNDILLQTGSNTITVKAYDAANNSRTDTLQVTYNIIANAESCMNCHNGSDKNDYAGNGLVNPHPFDGAQNIRCTVCHGGDGEAAGKDFAHVPPPKELADASLKANPLHYFNRLTLTGIEKYADYTDDKNGNTYTALEYLQFINPGDLRVVSQGKSCGRCHGDNHVNWVMKSVIATETGVFSGATYAAGIDNAIPAHRNLYQDTAADLAFRAISNPEFNLVTAPLGAVGTLNEFPVISQFDGLVNSGIPLVQNNQLNPYYNATTLAAGLYQENGNDPEKTNRVMANTALSSLYHEQIAFTCGNCHLGSAGANNRFGDFRSSGCTACHMQYSPDGRSRSSDPNVNKNEPANADAINAALAERPHIRRHVIQNVAKDLPNGNFVTGIEDMACAGCHQGSNRTVMQFWGIRLDQNQDLENNLQYPANPQNFTNTATDTRLFDPAANDGAGNNTFNGRNANQYIAFEDYDGDGLDDTPADIHHEKGMGCIDCHGSRDLHGGAIGDNTGGQIMSRADQVVAITCESCHGTIDAYINTKPCLNYRNLEAECAVDAAGNVLRHVNRLPNGDIMLNSRLTGNRHYVPQTRDTIINNNKSNPLRGGLVYSPKASYAMGRADGDIATGTGPIQADPLLYTNGFSHTDSLDCVSCHAAWTNSCIGCHLAGEFDNNPANYRFSNITGERIAYNEQAADFTYITPIPFTLGVSSENMITQMSPAEKVFYRFFDGNNESQVFVFSDRNGNGNNPNNAGRNAFTSSSHNVMMPHSIRGKVGGTTEGPRYCVTCHLNTDSINDFGADYTQFFADMANNNFANLDFNVLQEHIGQNPGNQLNSPYFVHMAVGLGTGLFLFDETGCPVNPLDNNANRHYCPDGAPADNFDPNNVVYNLDRIVEATGISNASNNHPMKKPGQGTNKRGGSLNQNLSGPLGAQLIQKLADPNTGLILDSWIDADGDPQGNAAQFIR